MKFLKFFIILLFLGAGAAEARPYKYDRGYRDGCDSAKTHRVIRNNRAFDYSRSYRKGWYDGKAACRRHHKKRVYTYKRGYRDGCDSAKTYRIIRNRRAFDHSRSYRKGWYDGKAACRRHHKKYKKYPRDYNHKPHNYYR